MPIFAWIVSLLLIAVFGFLNNRYGPWWFAGTVATFLAACKWFSLREGADTELAPLWFVMYFVCALLVNLFGAWLSASGAIGWFIRQIRELADEVRMLIREISEIRPE